MAGLLDYTPDPMSMGLLGAGGALLTPRSRGGGFGAAMQAFPAGIMQAQEMQRQMQRDALKEKMLMAQMGEYEAKAADAKRQRELQEQLQAAARRAYTTPSAGSLGGGVAPGSQQGQGLLGQMSGDPEFDAAMLQSTNSALNSVGPQQGISAPSAGGFDKSRFMAEIAQVAPLEAMKLMEKEKTENPFAKVDPKDFTQESVQQFLQTGGTNYGVLKPVRKREFVNGVAVDAYSAEPGAVIRNPDAQAQDLIIPDGKGGYGINPMALEAKKAIAKAGASTSNLNVNTGQQGFSNERSLRTDFEGSATTKAFTEVQGAFDIINNALKNPSGANDLAAATKFMKLLDPGSVVRESELGMAMAATGVLDRAQNYAQQIVSGQKLTPQQRIDFAKSANLIYGAARTRYAEKAKTTRDQANKWQLDPDAVAPAAWKVFGYKSRDEAVRDAQNAIMKNPSAKTEIVRRLNEELGISDHGIK